MVSIALTMAVRRGRVEKGHARVPRGAERGEGMVSVAGRVGGETHAAEGCGEVDHGPGRPSPPMDERVPKRGKPRFDTLIRPRTAP